MGPDDRLPGAFSSDPGASQVDLTSDFRKEYSKLATRILQYGEWRPEPGGHSFSHNSWFEYFHPLLGKKLKCIHKPLIGRVQLLFTREAESTLKRLVETSFVQSLRVSKVGEEGTALEVQVHKLADLYSFNSTAGVIGIVTEATGAVSQLDDFMLSHAEDLIPFGLLRNSERKHPERDENLSLLHALEAQLFGLMWARAIEFSSPAVFEFPHLLDLYLDPTKSKGIKIPGMAGGFAILVRRTADGEPVVFTQSESRISAGGMLNEIRFGKIHSEPDDCYSGPLLEEWAQMRMSLLVSA